MRQRHLGRCDGEHCALVSVLAFWGLRWGEAFALRVWDVEYLRRRLVVAENAVQLGVDHVVGQTKGKAVRSVPIPEFVLASIFRAGRRGLVGLVNWFGYQLISWFGVVDLSRVAG